MKVMRKCPDCGFSTSDSFEFCPKCGKKLLEIQPEMKEVIKRDKPQKIKKENFFSKLSKKQKIVLFSSIGAVVLVIIILVVFVFGKNNKSELWTKRIGGNSNDRAVSLKKAPDGTYIGIGTTNSSDGDIYGIHKGNTQTSDIYVFKLDANGTKIWSKCFGGSGDDVGFSIIPSFSYDKEKNKQIPNGYILVGSTKSNNDGDIKGFHIGYDGSNSYSDIVVIKIDAYGSIMWLKSFGGSNDDIPSSIAETPDGNFIIGGYTKSIDGDVRNFHSAPTVDQKTSVPDAWVIKLDANGNKLWSRAIGGTNIDYIRDLAVNDKNEVIALGCSKSFDGDLVSTNANNTLWLLKLDQNGNTILQTKTGEQNITYTGNSIKITKDNNYVVAGTYFSEFGDQKSSNAFLMKLNDTFVPVWKKTFAGNGITSAESLVLDNKDNILVTGYTNSTSGDLLATANYDMFLLKLDKEGNKVITKYFGGTGNDAAKSIDNDGNGFIISGFVASSNNNIEEYNTTDNSDIIVIKIDEEGNWKQESLDPKNYNAVPIQQSQTTQESTLVISDTTIVNSDSYVSENISGSLSLTDYRDVVVNGQYGYSISSNSELKIIDLPTGNQLSTISISNPLRMFYHGNNIYIVNGSGLVIVDVSNPNAPSVKGNIVTGGYANDLYISGQYAFVADGKNGLTIVDVSNNSSPKVITTFKSTDLTVSVAVKGVYAYVLDQKAGLKIFDVSTPAFPKIVSNLTFGFNDINHIVLAKDYAFIGTVKDGVKIVDIRDYTKPKLILSSLPGLPAGRLAVKDNRLYVLSKGYGVKVLDITDVATSKLIAEIPVSGNLNGITGLANYTIVAAGNTGLLLVNPNTKITKNYAAAMQTITPTTEASTIQIEEPATQNPEPQQPPEEQPVEMGNTETNDATSTN